MPTSDLPPQAPIFHLATTTFHIQGTVEGHNQQLYVDGVQLSPHKSQQIRNHSPDGFSWGYGGSGPAQSALALCLHIFQNKHVAQAIYQNFKACFVSQWRPVGEPFVVTIDVADFLIEHRDRLKIALQQEEWEREDAQWQNLKEEEPEEPMTPAAPAHEWLIGDRMFISHPQYQCNAIIYDIYHRPDGSEGISLITEFGDDTGGWEPAMWHFIQFIQHTGLLYEFANVTRLRRDFERGYFTPYFN